MKLTGAKQRVAAALVFGDELYGKVSWRCYCWLMGKGYWDGETWPVPRWAMWAIWPAKLVTDTSRWITRKTAVAVPWETWKAQRSQYVLLVRQYCLGDNGEAPDRICWRI